MRIVLVALHFSEYSWNLAHALAEKHTVLAIFNKNNFEAELGFLPTNPVHQNLEVVLLPHKLNPVLILRNAVRLVSAIKSFNPDVIHIQEDCKDALMLALPWLGKLPFVLTIHDPLPHAGADNRRRKWNRFGLYTRILRRRCDAAIVHGEVLRQETEALIPRLKGRVFSILHGPLGPLSSVLDIKWEQGDLLFFGRIEAYKGLRYFIEAVRSLSRMGIQVKGLVAGRGEDLVRYRQELVSDPVFELYEGFVPNERVAQLFQRSNVVVLPYTDGTQSGVAAMALGYGRPVVASRVGGIHELVRHEENGILVTPCDLDELVQALLKLIQNQSLARNYAKNAAALSKGEISWQHLASKHEQVYLGVSRA